MKLTTFALVTVSILVLLDREAHAGSKLEAPKAVTELCTITVLEVSKGKSRGYLIPSWHQPIAPLCPQISRALDRTLSQVSRAFLEIDPSDPRNALQPTDVNHDGIGWDGWLGPSTIDRLESLVLKMKNGSDVRSRAMSVKRSQLRNVLGSAISPGWVYDYPAMDQLFTEAAHRRHIEVSSVETKRDQLQRYDVVTNAAINRFIDSAEIVLGDPSCSDPAHTEIFQFQSLWLVTTGQFDRAFRVYESDRCNPSLEEEETTVLSRSPPIANRIDQVLSEGQPTAFAIGTLHLTGPDSVQRHLQRLGYRVRVWTQFNP